MNAPLPPVTILLLNYGGAEKTLECLNSLQSLDYPDYRVIVVDNDSPDNSVERLKARLAEHPGEFELIVSDKNLGFSGGNNLGIRRALENAPVGSAVSAKSTSEAPTQATETYLWLLNNDTTIAPDALSALVNEAQRTGGVAGSLLLYPDGRYQQVGTRIRWWTGGTKGYKESEVRDGMAVETLTGASMLIPFSAFRRAGLMDESYFLYFEDGELSLRLVRAGFPLTIATGSKVYHAEGATTGRKSRRTQYYYHRNRMRMLFKFANPAQKITIGAYAAFRLLRSVVKSRCSPDAERRVSAKIQWLALRDFIRNVSGPCPHDLDSLR